MGRSPSHEDNGLKKGPWTPEEDEKLVQYIQKNGLGSWRALPKLAGLNRCGKSCRLRWTNYLKPDIKRGKFSQEEEQTILHLHSILGNKWSAIATHLPGRTDNEIKNFWNTHLKKKLIQMGFDPMTHQPRTDLFASLPHLMALANLKFQYQNLLDHHKQYNSLDLQLLLQNLLLQHDHSTNPNFNSFTGNNSIIQSLNGSNDAIPDQSIMSLVSSVLGMNESHAFSNMTHVVGNPSPSFPLQDYNNNNNNNHEATTCESDSQPLHHIPSSQEQPHHHDMINCSEQVPFASHDYHVMMNRISTNHQHDHDVMNMSDHDNHQGSDLTMLSLQGSDGDSPTWFNLPAFQPSPSDNLPGMIESDDHFDTSIMSSATTSLWPQSFSR